MKKKLCWSKSFVVRPKEVRILSRISKLCRRWDPLDLSHLSEVLSILIHSSWSLVSSFQRTSYISWVPASPLRTAVDIFIAGSLFSFPCWRWSIVFPVWLSVRWAERGGSREPRACLFQRSCGRSRVRYAPAGRLLRDCSRAGTETKASRM